MNERESYKVIGVAKPDVVGAANIVIWYDGGIVQGVFCDVPANVRVVDLESMCDEPTVTVRDPDGRDMQYEAYVSDFGASYNPEWVKETMALQPMEPEPPAKLRRFAVIGRIPEDGEDSVHVTVAANAQEAAKRFETWIYQNQGREDEKREVEALHGAPVFITGILAGDGLESLEVVEWNG